MADLPQAFRTAVVAVDGAVTLAVGGELDLANAGELRLRLDVVIEDTTGALVLDLSDVTFLDSTGLVVMLTAQRRLSEDGRQLTVRNPTKSVHRVLALAKVLDVLGIPDAMPERERPTDITA